MVWSSVPLDREHRVTVAALLPVHKRPWVGISGKPVRSGPSRERITGVLPAVQALCREPDDQLYIRLP